jgi:DNA-binding Lrp family transcriptional regulator
MKTILLLFFSGLLLGFSVNTSPETAFNSLERAFKEGDSKKIVAHVDEKILLEINRLESVYSKSQAELILKDFFEKNNPKDFSVKSKSLTKGNYALLGTLNCSNKSFRVSIKLRELGNYFVLDKISITAN